MPEDVTPFPPINSRPGFAIDNRGCTYLTGFTYSLELGEVFENEHASWEKGGEGADGFIAMMSPAGNELEWGRFFGGTKHDEINCIFVDTNSTFFYIAGTTKSRDLPLDEALEPEPYDAGWNAGFDIFVAKFDNKTGVAVENRPVLPSDMDLTCYPNPFNAVLCVSFNLPEATHAVVSIYDLMGRKVTTLVDGRMDAGSHQVLWNADYASSGVYFARLETTEHMKSLKVTLLK